MAAEEWWQGPADERENDIEQPCGSRSIEGRCIEEAGGGDDGVMRWSS